MKAVLKLGAAGVLMVLALVWWTLAQAQKRSDKAGCQFNQRLFYQAVQQYRKQSNLNPGDPIDWSKIVGPGLGFPMERTVCPVHGEYTCSTVIPEPGILAASCRDPEHQPPDINNW